jgi:excisionase family DNA binding protein
MIETLGTTGILTVKEAALMLRCSKAHLCNVVNGKVTGVPHLPAVRIGRRMLFRRDSLEQWLREIESRVERRAAG